MQRRRERGRAPAPRVVHELTVPDELVAWGKQPEVARQWAKPWAHEVERFLKRGEAEPLPGSETEALLSRLEALCIEAIRAGRQELLLGIDLFTASWLGLRYGFETGGRKVVFGETLSYAELHELVEAPPDALDAALHCKELVSGVFPQARIGAIIDAEEADAEKCFGCGATDQVVMFTLNTGSEYCRKCWSELTARWPSPEALGKKKGKKGA